MFQRTTAINKILSLRKRKRIIQGGSSAGKTFGIIPILIDKCAKHPRLEVSVMAESIPHLKKGALKDFIKIMKLTGRWNEMRYNATDRKYRFGNDSYMEFIPPGSNVGARRNILYVNEANHITYEDYYQAAIRTSHDIFLDFNPTARFWAHDEVLVEDDAELLLLTYQDNEALPPNVVGDFMQAQRKAQAEKDQGLPITSFWQNWCRVYIDGEIGSLQGVVFNNWDQVTDVPLGAELLGIGVDFGFTNDPTAAIKVFRYSGELYCDEIIYETGLLNSDIISKLKSNGVTLNMELIPDSAEAKTIAELRKAGFRATAANKTGDSIRAGIALLQDYKLHITQRSTGLIKELRNYRWKVDKTGKSENEPIDTYNHAIDAIRYVALNKLNKNSGVYHIM